MNKNTMLIFGVLAVLGVSAFLYLKSKKNNETKDDKNNLSDLKNNLKNESSNNTVSNSTVSNNLNQQNVLTSPEEVSELVKEMEKLKLIAKQIKENKDKISLYEKMTCGEIAKINCFFPSPCDCQKTSEGKRRRLLNELKKYNTDLSYKLGLLGYKEVNGEPQKL